MFFISGKKLTLIASVVSAFAMQSAWAVSTVIGSGEITFSGEVVDATCKVDINGADNLSQTVVLNKLTIAALSEGTDLLNTSATGFRINLNGCASKTVQVTFANFNERGIFDNTAENNQAQNVGIQLFDRNGTENPLSNANASVSKSIDDSGSGSFMFLANYAKNGEGPVTAGSVKALARVQVTYE